MSRGDLKYIFVKILNIFVISKSLLAWMPWKTTSKQKIKFWKIIEYIRTAKVLF